MRQLRTLAAILVAVVALGSKAGVLGASTQDPVKADSDALDKILTEEQQKECGLRKLERGERDHLASLLSRITQRALALARENSRDEEAARALGWQPAREALEMHGYQLMQCAVVDVRGTTFFVVSDRFARHATKDLPIGFPSIRFVAGEYWCDDTIGGGIRSILVGGREHSFRFAEWTQL